MIRTGASEVDDDVVGDAIQWSRFKVELEIKRDGRHLLTGTEGTQPPH